MKTANFFTTLRIILAPVFFLLYLLPKITGFGLGASVFILIPLYVFMEFTDFLDGYYARKHNEVSDFGKHYDPFADVLANLTVFTLFLVEGYLPVALFCVILYREMSIMFLRMLAAGKGITIAARKGGKTKTVLYIVAAGFSLAIESAKRLELVSPDLVSIALTINIVLYLIAVVASLASFVEYVVLFVPRLRDSSNLKSE